MMEFIYFNSRDELLRIRTDKIVYFEGNGNYTTIVAANKLKSNVGLNLGVMEKSLASQLGQEASAFLRVGKRYIINTRYIFRINIQRQTLTLSDAALFAFDLNVSKEALKNMKQLIIKHINTQKHGTDNRA